MLEKARISKSRAQEVLWTSVVLLLGVIILYFRFGRAVLSDYALAPWGDTLHVTGPLLCEAGRQFQAGVVPVYDWVANEPLYYSAHLTTHYPFFFLWLDGCSKASAIQLADVIAVFHLAVSFVLFYATARVFGIVRIAALLAALFYSVSPDLMDIAMFPAIVAAAAWTPGIVLGLGLIVLRQRYALGAAVAAVSAGLLFAAGPGSNIFAPTLFMCLLVGALKCISLIVSRDWRDLAWTAGAVTVAGAFVLLLTGSSMLNLFEHLADLVRWTRHGAVFGSADAYPGEILSEKLTSADLGLLFAPSAEAFALGSFFLGAPLIALALVGLATTWRKLQGQIAAAFVIAPIFLVFLDPWNTALIAQYIPGLSHVRHLSLLCLPLIFGTTLLAGFGAMALIEHRTKPILVLGIVLLAGAGAWLAIGGTVPLPPDDKAAVRLATLAALLLVLTASFRLPGVSAMLLAVVVLHVFSIERLSIGSVYRTANWANEYEPAWTEISSLLDQALERETAPFAVAFDPGIERSDLEYTSAGTIALLHGIPSFHYNFSPRIAWKFEKTNYRYPDYAFYAANGAKYLIAEGNLPRDDLRLVSQEGGMRLYAFTAANAYVQLLCIADINFPSREQTQQVAGRLPNAPAVLADAIAAARASGDDDCPGSVNNITIDRHKDQIAAQLSATGPRAIIINVPPYQDWRLKVGGKRVPAYNLDDTRVMAWLPDGADGRATLTFAPAAYYRRLTIDAVGGVVALIWLGVALYRETHRSRHSATQRLAGKQHHTGEDEDHPHKLGDREALLKKNPG